MNRQAELKPQAIGTLEKPEGTTANGKEQQHYVFECLGSKPCSEPTPNWLALCSSGAEPPDRKELRKDKGNVNATY
jgi:hypothetical protein